MLWTFDPPLPLFKLYRARFTSFLRTVFRQDWVVYAKPAFGGPTQILRYLGRYTHRVAISNHRLLAFDGEHVVFRWKDYARGNKQRKMRLNAIEFLRRFVQHVLPRQREASAKLLDSKSLTLDFSRKQIWRFLSYLAR